jgi:hypothetical protein
MKDQSILNNPYIVPHRGLGLFTVFHLSQYGTFLSGTNSFHLMEHLNYEYLAYGMYIHQPIVCKFNMN